MICKYSGCSGLTSISIPSKVTSIGTSAFSDCRSLQTVNINDLSAWLNITFGSSESNPLSYGHHLVLNGVEIENLVIPSEVTRLNDNVFSGAYFSSVSIPSTTILGGNYIFADAHIGAITINNYLGKGTFFRAQIGRLVIAPEVTGGGNDAFLQTTIDELEIPYSSATLGFSYGGTSYPMFRGCKIGKATINRPIASSYYGSNTMSAFDITTITELHLGPSALYRGNYLCQQTTITDLYFDDVTDISANALYNSSSSKNTIKYIHLPATITSIGSSPLPGTVVIAKMTSPVSIDTNTFSNRKNATLYVPEGSKEAYETADYWKEFKRIVEMSTSSPAITFADAAAKAVCVSSYWDADGDGELSEAEAAAIADSSLDGFFSANKDVTSFDEFKFFTGITNIGSGSGIFDGCSSLRSVRLPNSAVSIGSYAFSGCTSLASIDIPQSVTNIGYSAFKKCSGLTTITIPVNVTSIGESAFDGCSNLTSVIVEATEPITISANVFSNSSNATLYVPYGSKTAYEAADGWKEFNEIVETTPSPAIAFADANVKAICVANWDSNGDGELSEAEAAAVTDLGEVFKENRDITSFDELEYFTGLTDLGSAFETCTELRSIVIPVNVVALDAVGNLASLESIRVVEGNTKYDSRNNCNAVIETETNKLVMGCQTTIIPEGITVIGQNAFGGRWGMREINFPASLKTIDESAFAYCISLNNIKLPSGLETIQDGYFGAFANCEGLKEVIVEWAEPLSIPAHTFEDCDLENATLYVPAGTKAVYEAADVWKDFGTIVEISGTIFTAEVNGLQMQFRVTDAFKKEVETYGTYEEGPAIDPETEGEVVIPAEVEGYTVTGIGGWSFRNCEGITAVSLPTTLTYIGESAFRTCSSLREVDIPEGVTTIGERAFFANLHKVTLPSTLQEIGNNCTFKLSQDDDNIVIVNNPEPIAIPDGAFEWDSMKRSVLIVPLGSREAYQAADYWKEFKEIVEMTPESEPADIDEGTYLLKNVGTGLYLNKGNRWGTHAVLSEEGMPVRISQQEDGSYTLFFPYGSANQQMLFRDSEEGVYVDYNGQEEGCPYWTITHLGDLYYIQSLTTHPVYGQEVMPGTYLGNNPEKEASDQDGNALGVYNDVDGNATVGMNITWQIEPDGPHTAAQAETLSQLIATLQELDLDSSWAQSVLDNSASTYSEMFGAIYDSSWRIEQKQKDIAKVNKLRQELALLISSARMVDVETSEAQAVYDNGNAGVDDIRTAMNTLRAAYIERLGEGVDKSLVPLDVTSVISNASFYDDDAFGWSYDNDMAPGFQSYNNAEYFQTSFDLHQTLTGLPNGSYVLRMKAFHRPGNNQTVFTEYQEGTNHASAELYANGESVVLQHLAAGARDNGDLGGAEVSYGDQTWYVPNSMQEARNWFDAEEGYFENELPVTVTDGTLTIGVRLGESVEEGWVIFDDFRLEYINGNQLYVDETPSVLRGSKAELSISLRNAAAVNMTDFYLQLPAGMTIVNSAVSLAADRSDNHQVSAQWNEEGYYHIVCHSGNNNALKENDGLLFSMTIACDESVAAGNHEGQVKNILMSDTDKNRITQPDYAFSIEVPDQQLGDVDGDGSINGFDIVEVVDNIMQRPSDRFNFAAANLYYDKRINALDLVRLINLVLRQPMTSNTLSMARRLGRMMSGEASDVVSALTIADFGINPGEQQAVDIELSNADHPYSLLEFELTLPEGVSLAKGQDGKWAVAPNSSRITSAHTITVEEIGQGQYKFLVYSTQNTAIEGSSGAIMTLTLTADADAPVGLQQGSITGQVLAEADEDGYEPADVSFSVNVGLLRGDANGDGRVSIADVVAVVDYVTTNGNPTGQFVASAADTDGVEGITIADAVAIVNMIIGE